MADQYTAIGPSSGQALNATITKVDVDILGYATMLDRLSEIPEQISFVKDAIEDWQESIESGLGVMIAKLVDREIPAPVVNIPPLQQTIMVKPADVSVKNVLYLPMIVSVPLWLIATGIFLLVGVLSCMRW